LIPTDAWSGDLGGGPNVNDGANGNVTDFTGDFPTNTETAWDGTADGVRMIAQGLENIDLAATASLLGVRESRRCGPRACRNGSKARGHTSPAFSRAQRPRRTAAVARLWK
jgi:hypothetical protein